MAKGKTRTGRLWTYVRDDQPFGGRDPPAAAFFYSRDRTGEHPERHLACFAGLMQADAYAGFNRLYAVGRKPGPIIEAACWAHARRNFFDLARLKKAPIAIEAVKRIDALFDIERAINGLSANERRRVRNEQSRPLLAELQTWLRGQRARLSSKSETAKAIVYALKRWTALTRFLEDGRLCMSNNAAGRALRCVAVGRRNWTFAGSDEGGRRAAAVYTLIETAFCRARHKAVSVLAAAGYHFRRLIRWLSLLLLRIMLAPHGARRVPSAQTGLKAAFFTDDDVPAAQRIARESPRGNF